MSKYILSLCDLSGAWAAPYARAGYHVLCVDLLHPEKDSKSKDGAILVCGDVTDMHLPERPHGVLAAPPCTCFCRPGARWWPRQDAEGKTDRDIEIMKACLRLCGQARSWWALENPPGRHQRLVPELGPPAWQYQPWQYGDPWNKQTYIWGTAKQPPVSNPVTPEQPRRTPNGKTQGRIARMSGTWAAQRAETPAGFAEAFFQVNP